MSGIPEEIIRLVAAEDARRDRSVQRALAALSDRERALVREAAVMGYVHGNMAGKTGDFTIPKDSEIVWHVITACKSFSDLYPNIAALGQEGQDGQ